MRKYLIQASEVVYYEIEVEAENEAQAIEKIYHAEVDIGEPVDGSDFMVGFVDDITEELTTC